MPSDGFPASRPIPAILRRQNQRATLWAARKSESIRHFSVDDRSCGPKMHSQTRCTSTVHDGAPTPHPSRPPASSLRVHTPGSRDRACAWVPTKATQRAVRRLGELVDEGRRRGNRSVRQVGGQPPPWARGAPVAAPGGENPRKSLRHRSGTRGRGRPSRPRSATRAAEQRQAPPHRDGWRARRAGADRRRAPTTRRARERGSPTKKTGGGDRNGRRRHFHCERFS